MVFQIKISLEHYEEQTQKNCLFLETVPVPYHPNGRYPSSLEGKDTYTWLKMVNWQ